jgi:hypothetical protein
MKKRLRIALLHMATRRKEQDAKQQFSAEVAEPSLRRRRGFTKGSIRSFESAFGLFLLRSVPYGSVTYNFFHGGNTGSNPVGDAKFFQRLTGGLYLIYRHKIGTNFAVSRGPCAALASVFA